MSGTFGASRYANQIDRGSGMLTFEVVREKAISDNCNRVFGDLKREIGSSLCWLRQCRDVFRPCMSWRF